MAKDLCPLPTVYPNVNIANHMVCINLANLGPADPREPSNPFWKAKADKWQVMDGEARTRLCMNCEHYDNSEENIQCVSKGAGGKLKASALPITPKWADIDGMPSAVCTRFNITCSALRTCDDWEPIVEDDMEDENNND
jgi:hypothetical protein